MQIFAGSASQELGKKIAEGVGQSLGRIELGKFSNGETRIRVLEDKVEPTVTIVQSLSSPADENLMEFCLIADALKRKGAREIVGVVPWLGYSKQDKVFLPGEALGAKVVARILQTTGITKLLTLDLHNRAILGFFDIPVIELSAKELLLEYFRKSVDDKTLVVAPDAGAVKAATQFARDLDAKVVYMDKKRDLVTGEVSVLGMSRSVEGANVIVIDDNVFTGATLLALAKTLKQAGAKKIAVGLTHHMYIEGVQEKIEQSEIDEMVVTDTVEGVGSGKLKVLSVAAMIGQELTNS